MPSAVFCYAAQDAGIARQIGAYLEANLPVTPVYDEGLVGSDSDLIDTVGGAISAEIAIVIFSPDSIPARWERKRWEGVFLKDPAEFGSQLFFVLGRPCKFPDLLRRQAFFDCSVDPLAGLRSMKGHLFASRRSVELPVALLDDKWDLEPLRAQIADWPGSISDLPREQALAFAHRCANDFEGAFWIDCSGRSAAGILGDTAKALGLTLTGSVEQNRVALDRFCEERRCLFLFENLAISEAELVSFGGRASVITVTGGEHRAILSIEETVATFSRWARNPESCYSHLRDAHYHVESAGARLGDPLLALLKHENRLAEANEILEILIGAARKQGDADALRQLLWEQSWILGHWGEPYNAQLPPMPPQAGAAQLGFNFA